jgi:CheY-like chemotaxis protein
MLSLSDGCQQKGHIMIMQGTGPFSHAAARDAAFGGGCGPRGRAHRPAAVDRPDTAPPENASDHRSATRVLIVDDGASAREGLCALLATFPDIEVVAAVHDGSHAVALAHALQPDVVLLDARLPLLDGLTVTRLVKASAPTVRVIILSFSAAYRTAALEAGADAFLVKGGPFEELVSAIRQQPPAAT